MRIIHKYRPAVSAFLLSIAVSITSTAISFLNQPVAEALGVGLGSFTLYCSICGVTGTFAAPFVGLWLGKYGIKKILIIASFWTGIGLYLYSFANALWMFYLIGALMGIISATAMSLCSNVILQAYYQTKEAANLVGIVMAGTGVGGMLFSAVMPGILSVFGWSNAYRILGCCWFFIITLAVVILGNSKAVEQEAEIKADICGMTRAEALRSPILYLVLASIVLLSFGNGISQHIPNVLAVSGFSNAQIARMMSFYTGMLALGKILQGILYSRKGLIKGGIITYSAAIAGFLLLNIPAMAYFALAMLAIGVGIVTTLFPLLAKILFGQKEYAQIYSLVTTAMCTGTFISTPLWGLTYDITGKYNICFFTMAFLIAISFGCQIAALKIRQSNKKDNYRNAI